MFTGIIEELGLIKDIQSRKNLLTLTIYAKKVLQETKIGDSVAVDGVCLTVTKKERMYLTFDVMKETLLCTTLQNFKPGQKVNLERALKVGDRLGGHFVTGHVDGIGEIKKKTIQSDYVEYQIIAARPLMRYVVAKGSIALDGISLTVGNVKGKIFSVYLIPHTLAVTHLKTKRVGDKVNLETDLLAKYIRGKM